MDKFKFGMELVQVQHIPFQMRPRELKSIMWALRNPLPQNWALFYHTRTSRVLYGKMSAKIQILEIDQFCHCVAIVLTCRTCILGQIELRTPFCAAHNASPFDLHRSPKFDSNPEIFYKNRKNSVHFVTLHMKVVSILSCYLVTPWKLM